MDILPPELWGLVQDYIPDSDSIPPHILDDAPATRLPLVYLIEPDVTSVCRKPVMYWCPVPAMSEQDVRSSLERLARVGGLVSLTLERYRPEQINRLVFSHIRHITITLCDTLTNVEPLKNIPHVSLLNCAALTDISPLGAQQSVSIRSCPVLDVSSLAHVKQVSLIKCRRLTSISGLGRQKVLIVGECKGIADLSAAATMPYLVIWKSKMTELFESENEVLTVEDCSRLTDISKLKNVRHLRIHRCPNIAVGLSALQNVCGSVSIDGLTDLSMLRARHIRLYDSPVANISRLRHAEKVTLHNCPNVVDVSPLQYAREVTLSRCAGVKDITPLANVRMLELSDMDVVPQSAPHTLIMHRYSFGASTRMIDCAGLRNCYSVNITQHPNITKALFREGRVRHLHINGEQ